MNSTDYDFALEEFPGEELHQVLQALKKNCGPVAEVRFFGLPAYLINDAGLIKEAFRNEQDFPPADIYRMFLEPLIGRTFQTMEGDEHRIYRQLATPSFKPSVLKHFDLDYLTQLGNELIDEFTTEDTVDLAKQFTHLFPFIVISRLLGIPRDKERQFQRWAVGILSFAKFPQKAEQCRDEMVEYLKPIIHERRQHPENDLISELTKIEVEGRKMTDEELMSTVHLMFSAGATTTHDAMGNLLYGLLKTDCWYELKNHPDKVSRAIEEVLRWEPPVALLPRTSSQSHDIELGGFAIPAGSIVLFALAGVNRDGTSGRPPQQFSLQDSDYKHVLSFGHGYRMCPGFHLAKLQLTAMTQVLLDRIDSMTLVNEQEAQPTGTALRGPGKIVVTINGMK